MSHAETTTGLAVTVDFAPPADPERVEGTVIPPDGRAIPFSGWMALLEVLETVTGGVPR